MEIDVIISPITQKLLREEIDISSRRTNSINSLQVLLKKIAEMQASIEKMLPYWKSLRDIEDIENRLRTKTIVQEALATEKRRVGEMIQASVDQFFHQHLINKLYGAIDPHPLYTSVSFVCRVDVQKPTLDVVVTTKDDKERVIPNLYFSSAQINVLSLSIFLARALKATDDAGNPVGVIFIDDPIQSMDSLNILSTIDVLRSIVINSGKQIILSTHDENFHELLQRKIPSSRFNSKFIEFESYGKLKPKDSLPPAEF